jgi:ABC-2 type transport system ATP-binding protein
MVHTPPILVLDEPTAGVDVELRQQLWSYVRKLNEDGVTVLLTTHYLEEAQELCDRIAIINHGKVIASEPTANLLGRIDAKELVLTLTTDLAAVPESLQRFAPELIGTRRLRLHYKPKQTAFGVILTAVEEAGLEIADLSTVETDLEDVFLQLTRRAAGSPA